MCTIAVEEYPECQDPGKHWRETLEMCPSGQERGRVCWDRLSRCSLFYADEYCKICPRIKDENGNDVPRGRPEVVGTGEDVEAGDGEASDVVFGQEIGETGNLARLKDSPSEQVEDAGKPTTTATMKNSSKGKAPMIETHPPTITASSSPTTSTTKTFSHIQPQGPHNPLATSDVYPNDTEDLPGTPTIFTSYHKTSSLRDVCAPSKLLASFGAGRLKTIRLSRGSGTAGSR